MGADTLDRARRVQDVAAQLGFDWPEVDGAWDKLAEEMEELRSASPGEQQREELGDLLFMLVNLSRHLGLDARQALEQAIGKFDARFAHVQAGMRARGLPMRADHLEAMEALWQAAKRLERGQEAGYRSGGDLPGDTDRADTQGDDQ